MPSQIAQLLDTHSVDPARLWIEVTESAAINSMLKAERLMRAISALGCRFALDDFGSGYASYAYLRQLPVDQIKIDGAFIRNLAANREDRIFVRAITDIAHGMAKTVTAEYVEDDTILGLIRQIGVDYAQGGAVGRPVTRPPPRRSRRAELPHRAPQGYSLRTPAK